MILRGLERVFGVWRGTVLRWLREWVESLPKLSQTLLPGQASDGLELDESWSFIQQHFFERWLWTAMCRRTRQIVAYAIGDRSQATCRKLKHRLPLGYRDCRPTVGKPTNSLFPLTNFRSFALCVAQPTMPNAGTIPCVNAWVATPARP